jgi:hypothetical protein
MTAIASTKDESTSERMHPPDIRAHGLELLAQGLSAAEVSKTLKVNRKTVAAWKRRYLETSTSIRASVQVASTERILTMTTPDLSPRASVSVDTPHMPQWLRDLRALPPEQRKWTCKCGESEYYQNPEFLEFSRLHLQVCIKGE